MLLFIFIDGGFSICLFTIWVGCVIDVLSTLLLSFGKYRSILLETSRFL